MPFLSELGDTFRDSFDPTYDESRDPEAVGANYRTPISVSDEVGRRTIQRIQPELEGPTVGGFFSNLATNVGEFATGLAALATYPVRHPVSTAKAIASPIDTATTVGSAVIENYKQSYTPKEGESIPGMIMRRFYEKPFDSLMDASAIGQIAAGGAGVLTRAATAGSRGAVAAGRAGEALVAAAGGVVAEAPTEAIQVAQRAAAATRAIDLFDAAAIRAQQLDPISIAQRTGTVALQTFAPDALAALRATSRVTDQMAERTTVMRTGEAAAEQKVTEAFADLNPAERQVIWPYISGRVNLDRPVGEQLMTHTGEWVPVKGDTIRPDALEAARQQYIPIKDELERIRGLAPEQVQQRVAQKSLTDARQFLGAEFDPFHPEVQDFVTNNVKQALVKNEEYLKSRASGEMRTSLDIQKERAWRMENDAIEAENLKRAASEQESLLPHPGRTSVDEALRAMGPQGGIYWPHSAEAYTREQSTIRNVLTKMGEASTYKENEFALYQAGVMEHQDPVKQLLRTYASLEKGQTWTQMAYEAAEQGVKEGRVSRMPKEWNPHTDKDVIAGTHQPFHPGRMYTDDLVEEEGQHMLVRLMEVSEDMAPTTRDATITAESVAGRSNATGPHAPGGLPTGSSVGDLNFADIMRGLVEQADKGPIYRFRTDIPTYKVPSEMGHSFAAIRESLQPSTNPIVRLMDNATQWWNWTNLNVKLTRLVNNVIGNTAFAAMQGVTPFTPRGIHSLIAAGEAIGAKAGLLKGERATHLAKAFDLPGIRSGGLQLGLEQVTGTVGDRVMHIGEQLGALGRMATAPVRGIGKWGSMLAKANANIESAYRAASLFYEMSPNAIQRAQTMFGHGTQVMELGERIEGLAKAGADVTMKNPEYRAALKQVNRFFNNYDRTTPFERTMVRRIFPYYKFFKHSTDLITRFPFEHPLKGAMARTLGKSAFTDVKDTLKQWGLDWDRDVPASMRDSLPIARSTDPDTGKPVVWMYNTKGPNPFSQMNGYASEQALQLLNPVVRIAIERATGINLFTRERYRGAISSFTGREVDPHQNGQIVDSFNHPSFGEAFLRSFWPYQTVRELAAQGRIPTDTASLLEMATNGPNAWQYDERGFPERKPQLSPFQALGRFVGAVPQPLQEPTKKQRQARKGVVSQQLTNLLQRYPERRDDIMAALQETGEQVYNETE